MAATKPPRAMPAAPATVASLAPRGPPAGAETTGRAGRHPPGADHTGQPRQGPRGGPQPPEVEVVGRDGPGRGRRGRHEACEQGGHSGGKQTANRHHVVLAYESGPVAPRGS
ncbi:hypothetical protein GCM10010383_33880 [Streptomyces lomondensis]|uniref:Uncharacterized protein n=1 Tax=Streptomyces lomondensis TaxID=68229 RepID=A0ABQ2X643_9ACTN|nr:hypothetical protein GCM10010383_33880 [Streptomyces lomondensis]